MTRAPYTAPMGETSVLEDWRGVDVVQIRAQLRLSVKERVRVMVEAANVLIGVQEHARRARDASAGVHRSGSAGVARGLGGSGHLA